MGRRWKSVERTTDNDDMAAIKEVCEQLRQLPKKKLCKIDQKVCLSDLVPNTVMEVLEVTGIPSACGNVRIMKCVIEKYGVRQSTPRSAVYKETRRPKERSDT